VESGKLRQNLYCRSFALLMTARSQSGPLRSIFSLIGSGARNVTFTMRSSGGFGGRPIFAIHRIICEGHIVSLKVL
jgi:hypothetical protein